MTTSQQTTSIKTINLKTSKKTEKGKIKRQQPANTKQVEPANQSKAIEAERQLCNKLRIRQGLHG